MTEAPAGFAGTAAATRAELLGAPVRTPRPSRLERALELSPKAAEGAAALHLHTVGDLLEHVPRALPSRAALSSVLRSRRRWRARV